MRESTVEVRKKAERWNNSVGLTASAAVNYSNAFWDLIQRSRTGDYLTPASLRMLLACPRETLNASASFVMFLKRPACQS
jgi:hypothetical protein